MISLNQYQKDMKNVFEKISNRFVSEIEFSLLYKMIDLIKDEPIEFNNYYKTYITVHYSITVTKKRAYAKPIYGDYYAIIIKQPTDFASI